MGNYLHTFEAPCTKTPFILSVVLYPSVILAFTHEYFDLFLSFFSTPLFPTSTYLAFRSLSISQRGQDLCRSFHARRVLEAVLQTALGFNTERDQIISGGKATPSGLQPSRSLN